MAGFTPRTYWVDDTIDNLRIRVTLFHDAPPRAEPAAVSRPAPSASEETEALLPSSRRARRAQRGRGAGETSDAVAAAAVDHKDASSQPLPLALAPDRSMELGTRANPYVREFGWQEKVLGPSEVRRHRRKRTPRTPAESLGAGLSRVTQLFARPDAEKGFRDRSYAEQVAQLDAEASRNGRRLHEGEVLHSKVHVDRFVDARELYAHVTTSEHERPTPLAKYVLSGRAYDGAEADGAAADARAAAGDGALGGDGARGLVVKPPPSQVMHIVAELGDPVVARAAAAEAAGSSDEEEAGGNLYVLCTLRAYANGRLDMAPAFSPPMGGGSEPAGGAGGAGVEVVDPASADGQWYRLSAGGRVWRFRLENLGEQPVDEAERRAERGARMQELLARKHLGGVEFTPAPARGGLVAHLFAEVVGAHGFPGSAPLLVQFFVHVNEGWVQLHDAPLHGITHASHAKWVAGEHGGEYACHFGHHFELSLAKQAAHGQPAAGGGGEGTGGAGGGGADGGSCAGSEQRSAGGAAAGETSVGAGISASGFGSASMGSVFVQVVSQSRFGRCMVEGYGYVPLLPHAGMRTARLRTWRPLSTTSSHIRRFFVSEGDEISDLRYLCVPSGVPSRGLNKYGFTTEAAGTVVLRLNCVTQAEPKPRAQKSSLAPGRAADGGSGVGGGRAGGGEGGMSKAELVRSKLEARQREREQQSLARSSGAPPAAAPRRRAAAADELSPGPSGEALERAEGGGLS